MRFIFGVIVGALVTVGAAYVADTMGRAPGPDGHAARPMVNWDVVSADLGGLSSSAQTLWNRLAGDARSLDKKSGN